MFITFEGGEGTGKSTQIKLLADHLIGLGRKVVVTREPGGTAVGEALRAILVNGDPGALSSTTEALLNTAARDVHLRHVIRPALARGEIVLCDRFMDSTRVYQGFAGDCDVALVDSLQQHVVAATVPDVTFVFDLDPAVGLRRAKQRGQAGEDRYERKGMAFHQKVRAGFLEIANADPKRCVVVDASGSVEVVQSILATAMERRTNQNPVPSPVRQPIENRDPHRGGNT